MTWSGDLEMFPILALQEPALIASAAIEAGLESTASQAWCLRQQDSALALELAEAVLLQLPSSPLDASSISNLQARMRLVQAELALLGMHLDEAHALLDVAEQQFSALQDLRGLCDVHWLRHYEAADRGLAEHLRQSLETAIELAERLGDPQRLLMLQLTLARSELFRDQTLANQVWDQRLPRSTEGLSPACAAALADYRGLQSGLSADFAPAAHWLIEAYRWSIDSGQLRRALSVASNLGYTYTSMSDYAQAVEWLQRGLSLARKAGWPGSLSLALAQTGDAMRRIGQLPAARELLLECQALLVAHPENRSAMLALKYLSEIELDLQENERALQNFLLLAERAQSVDSKDMQTDAALGQARALLRLGRLSEAREAALHARDVAQQQRERSTLVDILWTLAEIGQAEGQAPEAVLPWLQQALAQAERLPGYCPPPALLESAAAAHAACVDFSAAYQLSQRASEVRQQVFTEESGKQAAVLHVQHQVESARAEQEHLRQLAQSESERSQALQSLHTVLLHLGESGKEITAQLNVDRVLAVLQRHVQELLRSSRLSVFLLDERGDLLQCALGCVDPSAAGAVIAVADEGHECVRALRSRTELLIDDQRMVAPLQVADRVIGVMRVIGPQAQSFGEREQLIFRNLCAYAAVAMDNANAYEKLGELQRQVAAQEKMASIGQLAAGVAHEINNPIGFVNSNLGSLARDVASLLELVRAYREAGREGASAERRLHAQALERALDLEFLAEDLPQMIHESIDGLQRVKRIVQDLRSFSRVDASDWLHADLNEGIESTLNMLMHEIRYKAQVRKELQPLPAVYCLAAQINQVLMNLLVNASHAIERDGQILVRSWVEDDWACISVRDNGCGMPLEVQSRIFEPFFTTKEVGKGTGLGLSLSFSIIKKHKGRIDVDSAPGQGACFTLRLPVKGPDACAA